MFSYKKEDLLQKIASELISMVSRVEGVDTDQIERYKKQFDTAMGENIILETLFNILPYPICYENFNTRVIEGNQAFYDRFTNEALQRFKEEVTLFKEELKHRDDHNFAFAPGETGGPGIEYLVNQKIVRDSAGHEVGIISFVQENIEIKSVKLVDVRFKKLGKIATDFMTLTAEQEVYTYLGDKLSYLIGDCIISFQIINKTKQTLFAHSVYGLSDNFLSKIIKITKNMILNREYPLRHTINELYPKGKLKEYKKGFVEFSEYNFSKTVSKIIQKVVGINKVYGIGLVTDFEKHIGLHFFTVNRTELDEETKEFIEIYVGQASMALQRIVAEKEMRASIEAAHQANKAKSEFLANMSHELRTPMNAIMGLSEVLSTQNCSNLTEEQLEGLQIINHSGQRLLTLINGILDLSKIEAGETVVKEEEFFLQTILDDIRRTAFYLIQSEEVDFRIKKDERVPDRIVTDKMKLHQILINLIGNAVKFTSRGYIELEILIKADILFFTIRDTGIGIASEDLPKIFAKFKQLDSSHSKKYFGSGIGLSISKRFIELLGGEIWVKSELQKGSEFIFTIPIKEIETDDRFKDILILQYDRDIAVFMIRIFLQTYPFDIEKIRQFLKENDFVGINRVAHSIKSLLYTFGCDKAGDVAFQIEKRAKKGALDGLEDKIDQFIVLLEDTGLFLIELLGFLGVERQDIESRIPEIIVYESSEKGFYFIRQELERRSYIIYSEKKRTTDFEELYTHTFEVILVDLELAAANKDEFLKANDYLRNNHSGSVIILIGDVSKIDSFEGHIPAEISIIDSSLDTEVIVDKVVCLFTKGNQEDKIHDCEKIETRNKGKILVVEDEKIGRFSVNMMLKDKYNLDFAINGSEALEKYAEFQPDLVLLDIIMPEMNGFQVLEKMRKEKIKIPVIALTANAMQEDREAVFAAGFDDYITKPIDIAHLLETIQKYIC